MGAMAMDATDGLTKSPVMDGSSGDTSHKLTNFHCQFHSSCSYVVVFVGRVSGTSLCRKAGLLKVGVDIPKADIRHLHISCPQNPQTTRLLKFLKTLKGGDEISIVTPNPQCHRIPRSQSILNSLLHPSRMGKRTMALESLQLSLPLMRRRTESCCARLICALCLL